MAAEPSLRPSLRVAVVRGARGLCPRCGKGQLFRRFHAVEVRCASCGCEFLEREGDCWGFLYVTMAIMIGLLGIAAFFLRPTGNEAIGRVVVLAIAAAVLIGTLPLRKGIAMALDIYADPVRSHAGESAETMAASTESRGPSGPVEQPRAFHAEHPAHGDLGVPGETPS
ncbi:MAG TPA: DUF983 domain-containing protein [Planctomycetota bacterium]|nr:DUF983 domain-containing protein [Planctomycetota bacterium]